MTTAASGIFDNGFIKFGYSGDGSFGYGSGQTPGIFYDTTGEHVYPSNADFLTPGSPFEFFAVKIGGTNYVNNNTNYNRPAMPTTTDTSGVVTEGGKTYGTLKFISTINGLEITQTYTLGVTDEVISISVSMRNTTADTIYGVKYARGIDPDVDSPLGTTRTTNERGAGDIADSDIIMGTGPISDRVIGLYTNSSMTHNTSVSPGWSTDPATLLAGSSDNFADSTINLAFDVGDLAAGQTKNFSLAYVFAANEAALAETIETQVPPSNPAPTLDTFFDDAVATIAEEGTVELSFEDLLPHAADKNADESDGSIAAFVIKDVSSGTLMIGTSAETATAWAESSHDALTAGMNLYWTPAANANGELPAFTIAARDADGGLSAAKAVTVNVTPVNDAPTLSTGDITLPAVAEDVAVNAGHSVADLFTPRFADVDGDALGGIAIDGNAATPEQGEWQYSTDDGASWHEVGTVDEANALVLPADALVRFEPAANWHGTEENKPGSLTVHAVDATQATYTEGATRVTLPTSGAEMPSSVSVDSRSLETSVDSVNDAPAFDPALPVTGTLADTKDWDTGATLGALSGTLSATDADVGDELSYGIRGGIAAGDDIVRQGTYGRLTVDATSGEWTYEVTNAAALNALPAGASATEAFDLVVRDGNGGQAAKALTITLTGTNDEPVLSHAIGTTHVVGAGSGDWSFQIPANTITDAEGLPLTYTITLLDSAGNPVLDSGLPVMVGSGSTDLGDGSWVTFDAANRTLTGHSTRGEAHDVWFKVTASDGSVEVSDSFTLYLEHAVSATSPATNLAPVASDDRILLAEDSERVLTLDDFGAYADDGGTAPAQIKIISVPASGWLYYDTASLVKAGDVISAADIAAGKLSYIADEVATDTAVSIGFQVGDGDDVFSETYQLRADVTDTPAGTAVAGTDVDTAAADVWTAVYHGGDDAVTGFDGQLVRVVVQVTNGTLKLGSTLEVSMITTGYGDPSDGEATSLAFEGSQAEVNAALQTLLLNRTSGLTAEVSVKADLGGVVAGPNGHYYQAVSSPGITWSAARDAAAEKTFNGLTGYLVTITGAPENTFILDKLASNAWIGASDEGTEGTWKWVTGPEGEIGQTFYIGADPTGETESGWYSNWQGTEPNNSDGDPGEDYAQFFASGVGGELTPGMWNDLPHMGGTEDYAVNSYIVEYGGMAGDAVEYAQAVRTITIGAPSAPVLAVAASVNYTENASPVVLTPDLMLTGGEGAALASATVRIASGQQPGDELAFTANLALYGNIAAATYDDTTGTLTLTSAGQTATLAQWQAALQSVTFVNADSDAPGVARTIEWQVSDGETSSAVASSAIAITEVNDAPTVTHLENPAPAVPGELWSYTVGELTFSDPEGGAIVYSARLADNTALPDWLTFDAATRTFSGNPPAGAAYLDIKVIGTDSGGKGASTTFTLQLADTDDAATAANNPPGLVTLSDTTLSQGDSVSVSAPSDADGVNADSVAFQWQASSNGTDWIDIAGATASTFTLGEAQVGQQVRAQVFYNDLGGTLETVTSNVSAAVANVDDEGSGSIAGLLMQNSTLVASFSDADGLTGATPTYEWYRVDGEGAEHKIDDATHSGYTITADDGGHSMRVKITYTDDKSGVSTTLVIDKAGLVDLAAIAPVAGDTTGSAQEAGGVANAEAGHDATGNLLANATDANDDPLSVTELRAGGTAGSGAPAATVDGELVVAGSYGTLYVDPTTGAYRYVVSDDNETVQALVSGDTTLTESFNYVVSDDAGLTDTALLTVTVSGQNDAAVVTGIPLEASVTEDTATPLPLGSLVIADPDAGGSISIRLHVDTGTLRAAVTDGITITGDDTDTLTITADTPFGLSGWLKDNDVSYVSPPHSDGSATLSYELDDGSGFKPLAGTTEITSSATNDAPIVDLDPLNDRNDGEVTFRPRGEAVQVAPDITIASGDDDEDAALLGSATVAIADGADDNVFGTLYETLDSTHAGDSYLFDDTGHLVTISGRGTTTITLTGDATRAEYETVLKTIVYDNANPNAASGDRTVTISVSDTLGQVSNAASFAIDAPNADITVGQRIFVDVWDADTASWDKTDTGLLVAEVSGDHQHFVASAPLTQLAAGAQMYFHGADNVVEATATQAGPLVATTTVHVPWTPVIDMNGEDGGRDHEVTYTEGQDGVAVATPDASITDQDGKIETVVVKLAKLGGEALDGADGDAEAIFISGTVMGYLTARGITVAGNGTHEITLGYDADAFPAGLDATDFQIALRGIQYRNVSDNPDVDTQRTVMVTSTDVDNHTGVGATTVINVQGVNDAPSGHDGTIAIDEDVAFTVRPYHFDTTETDAEGDAPLAVKIVTLPGAGTLTLDGVAVTAGQMVSIADIAAEKLVFTPAADGHGYDHASFTFQVQDDGGLDRGGVDLDPTPNTLTFHVMPVNDAPVLTPNGPVMLPGIHEDDAANSGQRVGDLLGEGEPGKTGMSDVDALDAGGATGRGIAIKTLESGVNGSGTWEYSLDDGAIWIAIGAVDEANALLLGSNDRIRYVPDGENGTMAAVIYHLWDGGTGTAGTKVDVSVRGGTSAFSSDQDFAAIEVEARNDAPTIDLGGASTFKPRGGEIAVFHEDFRIHDVDLDGPDTYDEAVAPSGPITPDLLVSATVAISADAPDNLFTTYETLRSTDGAVFAGASGNPIHITGNGSGEHGLTNATELTFTGEGTREDYENALANVRYNNTNPNATRGDREITVTVTDASVSTGDAADGVATTATHTVQVPWTPVIDMNGDIAAGRDHAVSYTEGSPGVAIAAADASIVDQDGNIAEVVVTLQDHPDGASERLFVSSTMRDYLLTRGITVSADGHAITLTGDKDGTTFQLALRAIQYVNESANPDTTSRVVKIETEDQQGNEGVGAQTTINLVAVNDAPEGIDSAVTLDEDTSHTFAMADFDHAVDPEGDALQSVLITTVPSAGTLTLDGVAVTAGQVITVADIDAGQLVYTPVADANGAPTTSFTFQLRDGGGTANGGVELDATPNTLTLNVNPVNDAPASGSVTISGSAREGGTLTAVPVITDVDRTSLEIAAATTYQWQVRAVPDGVWTDVAGATASTFVPTAAENNREVRVLATYEDVNSPLATVVYDSAIEGQATVIGNTDGDIVLVVDTDLPICIWDPEGDVDVTNTGTGALTVEGLPHGGTLTVDGEGDTTLSNPDGDVTVANAGPGTVTVTGLVDPAVVTTSGDGEVVIDDPQGGVDLVNNGAGEVTVRGLNDGETLDVSGNGPTTVADPDGDLTITNAGPGTVTATGVNDDAVVTTSGNGPIVIGDPEGSLELVNQGPGPVTVEGINDGEALVVGGDGSTTVSNPDGAFSLTNNGTDYVKVTGVTDGADVTTAGTGDVHIDQPQGDLDLVNDLSGDGEIFVGRPIDGAAVRVSGEGPTTVTDPIGDLTIANDGPGLVTAKCLHDGNKLTTSGEGDVAVTRPQGSVQLVNNQSGEGRVIVQEVRNGESVDVDGTGPTTVAEPYGDVTVNNNGIGLVTTTGANPDSTVTFGGSGPQAADLTGLPDDGAITLDNNGSANVDVLHAPDGVVLHAGGSGDLTVSAPAGDLTVDNDGTGTVHVDQPVDGTTVTKTGTGPAVIDEPAGSFTLANDDTGLVTVRGVDDGETVVITGTGPVAVESNLAAGEHVVVNTTANSNVQLSNLGAGVIDVVGDLTLDGGDALSLTLNGDGTTELTVAGAVSLAGTPLHLQLDPAYDANLGDTITLLDNDGGDAISGTFDGLPEGAPVYVSGQLFTISYVGGTGNDVVLTRINDDPTGAVTVTGTARQGETLTASHTLADTDGLGTVSYRWMADGALLAVGASYVVTQEAVGKAITAVATYTDAEGTAETVTSVPTAPVANVNDAPTGQVLVTGTPSLGQTLVASHTLADVDGLGAVSYQWQADGADIAGATGSTLLMGREQGGKAITVVASYVDGQGSAEQVESAVVADGSNVPADVQSQVPGIGSGGVTGDGNGDGVADTLQPSVVSTALEREGGAPSTFVTLVVDSVDGKVREGSTDRLMEFIPVDTPSDLPSWAQMPAGEIGFTAAVDTAGVTKNFSLYVDADLGINGYWSKNEDGVLVNLASEAYGGRIVEEGGKLRLDFQITEGGEFDHGTAGDDTIVNHGAAGHASLSLIGYTVDTPVAADGINMWD